MDARMTFLVVLLLAPSLNNWYYYLDLRGPSNYCFSCKFFATSFTMFTTLLFSICHLVFRPFTLIVLYYIPILISIITFSTFLTFLTASSDFLQFGSINLSLVSTFMKSLTYLYSHMAQFFFFFFFFFFMLDLLYYF